MVKIKSLPFDATQLDIIHFFEGFRLKPNGVQLVVRADYKPTGEVRFTEGMQGRAEVVDMMNPPYAPPVLGRLVRGSHIQGHRNSTGGRSGS